STPGEKFSIPGNSKFDIRVTESYHYICHFA
ncbi:pyrimidine/purine nucleoside phosphorylase, partial [Acinetobacter baumannii]